MIIKTYSELKLLKTYEERLEFLRMAAKIGDMTFGGRRQINQRFYTSDKWKSIRNQVIVRDKGCDLGIEDYTIHDRIYIHHINPLTIDDLLHETSALTDLNNLICCSLYTHNIIHYGTDTVTNPFELKTRSKNDTCPWRR